MFPCPSATKCIIILLTTTESTGNVCSGMKAGAYKICMTDVDHGSTAVWKESGVVLILQRQVSSISVNGIIEVVATIPQRLGDTPSEIRSAILPRLPSDALLVCGA